MTAIRKPARSSTVARLGRSSWAILRRDPANALLGAAAVAIGCYVVAAPFFAARYPMMTDMPFHAAYSSVLRHYADPSWHFREQFALQPVSVPYLSLYLLAALLMLFLPPVVATKAAAVVMLALLPVGLAVLFHGMRKSALLGLAGLGLVWGGLTHWGFLNYVGALGLFAMVIGLCLRLLDQPSRARQVALGAALTLVFFTHVFRFPFAIAAVVGTTAVMFPATRRWRPVVAPLALPLALLALWWWIRPAAVGDDFGPLRPVWSRLDEVASHLYHGLRDPAESRLASRALEIGKWIAIVAAGIFIAQGRWYRRSARDWAWGIGVTVVPLACALVFLALYLVLPMEIGLWWYVYPREITAAAFIALGALPDLPRQGWLRAGFVVALAVAVVPLGELVTSHYRQFDAATQDFTAVSRHIPHAPKLLYLVFDHSGSRAVHTPFIHLPAYVQAEKGGWLSFHFATWGVSPVVYRDRAEPGATVPPPTPLRWEWTPQKFRVREHGAFFDWFLVRSQSDPDRLFEADPSVQSVAREGSWWLYRRRADPATAAAKGG